MDFNATYGTYGTVLDTCKLCHPGYPLSYARNSFGSDYALATLGNHTFNAALENADSDGDGFTNVQEIHALTFPGDPASTPPPGAPTLDTLSINGPSTVNEGDSVSYEASALWSDGSTSTVSAAWAVSPDTFATISAAGLLTALEVSSDQPVTVSATFDGTTSTQTVTIADVPSLPAVSITLAPANGAVDVPVTAVVVATLNGSGDIASLVNDNTFSLSAAGSGGTVTGSIGYNGSRTEATFTPLDKLAYSTAYTATVNPATGTQQLVLASSVSTTFTTIAQTPDSDGDGVEDGEDDYPNDHSKATPPSVRGSGKILVDACGNAGIALAQCSALVQAEGISDMYPQFNRRGKPFGFSFPDGLVQYTLTNVNPGGTVTVSVTLPSGVPFGSKVFKVDANGFQEIPDAVVHGSTVTMTLTDGGAGDADGSVNGVIVDPIGVAVPEGAGGSTDLTATTSAGGCSVAGSDTGWKEAFVFFGQIGLVWLVLALRRRKPGAGA